LVIKDFLRKILLEKGEQGESNGGEKQVMTLSPGKKGGQNGSGLKPRTAGKLHVQKGEKSDTETL